MQDYPNNNQEQAPEEESNAAKLLRIRGGAEDKLHDEREVIREYDKAENFWYHHKWKIILVAVFLVSALILGSQVIGNTQPDASVMYVGPYYVGENVESYTEAFTFLTEDHNEDGEIFFSFASLHCFSDEQLAEMKEQVDANGEKMNDITYTQILQANTQEKESFYKIVFLDEFVIWLMDPAFYQEVKKSDGFVPLSEIFDHEIEAAIDDTGIRFMETEFAQYYTCFADLPADTVLCLRRLSTAAGRNGKREHAYNTETFRAIVEFKAE